MLILGTGSRNLWHFKLVVGGCNNKAEAIDDRGVSRVSAAFLFHVVAEKFRIGNTMEQEDDEQQQVWSWGAGTDGQLATGRLQDEHSPQLIRSLSAYGPIVSLSCGGAHVIALTSGGRVVTWGRGISGQLGHGEMVNNLQPKLVKELEGLVITHVSAGWNHSGFVSETGAIFTCGDGSFGQLGHGDFNSHCYPREVSYFASKPVEQVACGMRHSLMLLRGNVENPVYGFGSGKRGQLGISKDKVKSSSLPQITMGLENLKIISIYANGDHSAALSGDGSLYTWGRGFSGAPDAYIPCHFDAAAFPISDVALGWNHALLLTGEGEVYMLGGDRHGVLGDPQKTPSTADVRGKSEETMMQIIPGLVNLKVVQVATGAEHSAFITDNGSVMTSGWGEHGQLGLGNTNNQTEPRVVTLGLKFTLSHATPRVYCGSGFSFILERHDVSS
ncbi:Regulator of chromosome condensation family protein [Perilla frutescens var. hirtella]|nr:Regulator of chromosome condensation family protein [Perilla frutescens var. hirtella]